MLRFTTAGESHGPALVSVLEGVPAGLPLVAEDVDRELRRRQQGYGRGRRMQIEQDAIELLSGVRAGQTLGSPIGMLVRNRDWRSWQEIMDPAPREEDPGPRRRAVVRPRPGHADYVGVLKYDRADARDILERASARETTARVAAAAICRRLLAEFGISIGSHLVHLGGIDARPPAELPEPLNDAADRSPLRTLDADAEQRMIELIDRAKRAGDTLGGVCEVVCRGLPVGLGSHVSWDRKLDGRLAGALMSIPAVKGVEIGLGFEAARRHGSAVHDELAPGPDRPLAGHVARAHQPRRRAGGRHDHRRAARPARRDEADQHAHAAARHDRHHHRRAGAGHGRTERRDRRTGHGGDCRSDDGLRGCRRAAREVRRRLAGRTAPQRGRVSGAGRTSAPHGRRR